MLTPRERWAALRAQWQKQWHSERMSMALSVVTMGAVNWPVPPAAGPAQGGGEQRGEEEGAWDEENGGTTVWCAFCLERVSAAGAVRSPCGICTGSLAVMHAHCLRADMEANNRRSCSVCHKPYVVEEVVTRCDFRERLEHALQLYRNRLVVATFLLLAIASAFFYAYYLFTIKVLPSKDFGVRNPLVAKWIMIVFGCIFVIFPWLLWRWALRLKPPESWQQMLMSAPDEEGKRSALFALGPPRTKKEWVVNHGLHRDPPLWNIESHYNRPRPREAARIMSVV